MLGKLTHFVEELDQIAKIHAAYHEHHFQNKSNTNHSLDSWHICIVYQQAGLAYNHRIQYEGALNLLNGSTSIIISIVASIVYLLMMYSKDLTMRPNIQQYASFINKLTYEESY